METKEFQKKCTEIVKKLDQKYMVERDPQLSFVQLTEEIGEIAKEINKPRLRHKQVDRENLEGEFADVFLQFAILAQIFNVDLEKAVEAKIKILYERHGL